VRPLRAARRAIRRAADALGSPALAVGADRLMQAELAAERRQARLLADGASSLRAGPARACAAQSLAACLEGSGTGPCAGSDRKARGWPRWCSITEPGRRISKRAGPHV
jgi:hypothetical protein